MTEFDRARVIFATGPDGRLSLVMVPPRVTPESLLRDVMADRCRLLTWDTNRTDRMGKNIIGYRFWDASGALLWDAEDFACSPMHAIDSDDCLRGILGFLTLRIGDTDPEYFESYTPDQMAWSQSSDCEYLSLYAMDQTDIGENEPMTFTDREG